MTLDRPAVLGWLLDSDPAIRPVYRSLHRAIDITTALEVVELPRREMRASRR